MNSASTHDQIRDLLGAKALDALDPEELAAVSHHLSTCSHCCAELGEYCDAAGLLADISPLTPMPPLHAERMRARLTARAAADAESGDGNPGDGASGVLALHRTSKSVFVKRWSGWAVAAGLASLLLSHHAFHRPLDLGWLAAAVLGAVVVVLGAYAIKLHDRLSGSEDSRKS